MNLTELQKLPPEKLEQVLAFAEFLLSREPKRTWPVGTTAYDLVKDLVGCIDGPADLSTNKAYLEGLGED